MKTFISIVLIAIIITQLIGCATTSMDQLNGLLDQPISVAMHEFKKAPESHVQLPDGGAVYTWKWYFTTIGQQPMYEVVTIYTNSAGIITAFRRSGE